MPTHCWWENKGLHSLWGATQQYLVRLKMCALFDSLSPLVDISPETLFYTLTRVFMAAL